jgi:hypothetical protein
MLLGASNYLVMIISSFYQVHCMRIAHAAQMSITKGKMVGAPQRPWPGARHSLAGSSENANNPVISLLYTGNQRPALTTSKALPNSYPPVSKAMRWTFSCTATFRVLRRSTLLYIHFNDRVLFKI